MHCLSFSSGPTFWISSDARHSYSLQREIHLGSILIPYAGCSKLSVYDCEWCSYEVLRPVTRRSDVEKTTGNEICHLGMA
jgi:hypothetical protein